MLLQVCDRTLVSFDIDGTLELGDPPGPIPAEYVRHVREMGCIIGTASDRTLGEQRQTWSLIGLEPDFVTLKHNLLDIRGSFVRERYIHIGDTNVDEHFAKLAGFDFFWSLDMPPEISAALQPRSDP